MLAKDLHIDPATGDVTARDVSLLQVRGKKKGS